MQQHHGKAFPKGEKGEEASVYKLGGGDVHKLTMSVNENFLLSQMAELSSKTKCGATVQHYIFCKKCFTLAKRKAGPVFLFWSCCRL